MIDAHTLPLSTPDEPAGRSVGLSPLLETKLYVPRWRAGFISRPRLIERLGDRPARKLTLVSAPAGFGKTTLLAEWLTRLTADEPVVAWLSLDSNDNDPTSFWTYLIAALQSLQPGVGASALALLQSPQPPPVRALLPALLNELSTIQRDFALVLDDYHLIDTLSIHEDIAFLLDHLPPCMHLVITCRADPPLPLARLRARGELTEVRAADLRFTPNEAIAFLNDAMGLDLSAQHVDVLEARTEGWIAGLQLAALSMQGRQDVSGFIAAFSGDYRYIVDYLVEEVLQHQPDSVRQFLLQTSMLDRLSGPVCNAVTGRSDSKSLLETLERGNLFVVPLDDKRQWYRYHHLFADVLQAHLLNEQAELVPVLHRRASEWHEQNALPSEAIRHALAASDLSRAAGLIELSSQGALRAHQLRRLIEWLKPIPDNLIRSMPVLSTYYAMALQGVGQLEASASRLNDAEWWLDADAELADRPNTTAEVMVVVDQKAFLSLSSRIALARGFLAIAAGDATSTIEQSRLALDLLPADEHHWRGAAAALLALAHWVNGDLEAAQLLHAQGLASFERAGDVVLALSSASHHADILKARGRLQEAKRTYEHAFQLATQYGDAALPGMAILHFGFSDLLCEQGDPAGAQAQFEQGEKLSTFAAQLGTPYRHRRAKAQLLRIQGDLDGALDFLDQAQRVFVQGAVPDVRPASAIRARIWISKGVLAGALAWARERGLSAEDELSNLREFEHVTFARLLLAQFQRDGDTESLNAAEGLLTRLLEAADVGGRAGTIIEVLILQALLLRARGDIAAALKPLTRALTLAEPEGYVRLFIDEGDAMRDLLHHAVTSGVAVSYAGRLLDALNKEGKAGLVAAPVLRAGLTEQLTPREIEILRLLGTGLRNNEIADRLVISPSTVKRHIANAYGKLSVSHRTEALLRAKELDLL